MSPSDCPRWATSSRRRRLGWLSRTQTDGSVVISPSLAPLAAQLSLLLLAAGLLIFIVAALAQGKTWNGR